MKYSILIAIGLAMFLLSSCAREPVYNRPGKMYKWHRYHSHYDKNFYQKDPRHM